MKKIIILSLLFSLHSTAAFSYSCFLKAASELFIPGVGYLANGDYLQSSIWATVGFSAINTRSLAKIDLDNDEKIPDSYTEEIDDITYHHIFITRPSWIYQNASFLLFSTGFIRYWDLIKNNCDVEYDSFKILTSPLDFASWYNNPWVVSPLVALPLINSDSNVEYVYHLDNVSEDEIYRDSVLTMYMVGIWEELIFRDLIQSGLYNLYYEHFGATQKTAWHSGVITAAALFGVGHSGETGTATPFLAFLYGIYAGYIYQPRPNIFNINAAIGLHSWWDMLIFITSRKDYQSIAKRLFPDLNYNPIVSVNFKF